MLMEGAAEGGGESDGRTLTESRRGEILRELGERLSRRAYLFISMFDTQRRRGPPSSSFLAIHLAVKAGVRGRLRVPVASHRREKNAIMKWKL
ncbi:hypothetical protein EYF80_030854 [Liparis tanakae]|uniref:Uncharacterized protein n=1 Tax=Liparis tanakae TaxID=230148 RepID=A0A4Z2H025_9TELE|nr:hypothetical protein EYF80_030854 [Liparis tanakae]